jgi:CRP-like cAMP-binding protein
MNANENRLLAQLDAESRDLLERAAERIEAKRGLVLIDVDRPIEYVYFPIDAIGSIVSATPEGVAVETATVGSEGMVGIPVFLGTDRTVAQAFCQVSGVMLRVPVNAFREALERSARLRVILGAYTMAFITQTAQASACNRLHTMRQRCARWLLETHDRVQGDTFDLTQEFLAQMLGVRRATVSEVAASLQRDGLIEYEYRRITVVNRAGLEAAACDCYRIVHREYERLVQGCSEGPAFPDTATSSNGSTTLRAAEDPQSERLE